MRKRVVGMDAKTVVFYPVEIILYQVQQFFNEVAVDGHTRDQQAMEYRAPQGIGLK